jgi:hypothetical protein
VTTWSVNTSRPRDVHVGSYLGFGMQFSTIEKGPPPNDIGNGSRSARWSAK